MNSKEINYIFSAATLYRDAFLYQYEYESLTEESCGMTPKEYADYKSKRSFDSRIPGKERNYTPRTKKNLPYQRRVY